MSNVNKNGVKFGEKHSIDNWDLLMVQKNISTPTPKTSYVEIPGSNGHLDLTEAFGEILYNSRSLSFNFDIFQSSDTWWNSRKIISNYLHGQTHKIVLDQDPEYYYTGRCSISDFSNDFTVAHMTITAECDPYKYKIEETRILTIISPATLVSCPNGRKRVVPTIIVDGTVNFEFENVSYSLGTGTHKILNIVFVEGNNKVNILSGEGTIEFVYRQADL